MNDGAVAGQDERRGLQVRPAFAAGGVTADQPGDCLRIEAVGHREPEPQPLYRSGSVRLRVGGQEDDPGAERLELPQMLLKVSQLLTAVASPMASIKDQYRRKAGQFVGNPEPFAANDVRLQLGEALPDAESFHGAAPGESL